MSKKQIIVVGAGVAGARAAEAIAEHADARVVVVGAEPLPPYHRPIVSKEVLRGDALSEEATWFAPANQWAERGIRLVTNASAIALQLEAQSLRLRSGEALNFDALVIATGSSPRPLQAQGAELPGVISLRSLHEGRALSERLEAASRVVVIGAGPLGLEVSEAAQARGARVTLLERGRGVLKRMVGSFVSEQVTRWVSENVQLRTEQHVKRIVGVTHVTGVELVSGEVIAADTVVTALGVAPETRWLVGSGLELIEGAVRVDEYGRASHPQVFAAGEAAAAWLPSLKKYLRVEQYGWAWQHGDAVGRNVVGASEVFDATPTAGLTLWGKRVQVAGDVGAAERCRLLPGGRVAMLAREGVLCGVVGFDAPAEFARARRELGRPAAETPDWSPAP